MKLSDFIFKYLVETHDVTDCFMVTGGGAMHLNDSIGHTKGLRYICNHHEQASAIAAEGYYRASGRLPAVCVTTGPGGTNAVTGVFGAWIDSIPMLVISGQVKQQTTISSCPNLKLRQLGDQEADIISIVRPITKYAATVTNPATIKHEIDKAIFVATSDRPGPVWLDIPLDVQAAEIDVDALEKFDPNKCKLKLRYDLSLVSTQTDSLITKITKAKSPVIYVGNGVRLSGQVENFLKLVERLKIPVVTAISGSDIIGFENPLFFGKPGICGDRIGNIMVQNADLLLILGTRLSIRQISYAYDLLAPSAYKVMVDADEAEMSKPTLRIDLKIHADLRDFIKIFADKISSTDLPLYSDWIKWGHTLEKKLPSFLDDNPSTECYVNSYKFVEALFEKLNEGDVVVTGNGSAYTCTYQAMRVKKGVRVFANEGCAAMGYGLPAAIGAAVSIRGKNGRIILITGDGSIQMNLQELQTIKTYGLPIKIFIFENDGYHAIKTTQTSFFGGHFTGSNPESGVICPDMQKIATAYDVPFMRVSNDDDLSETLDNFLAIYGSAIYEIKMHPLQTLFPKSASFMDENGKMTSAPLEKMAPFMSDELQAMCKYHAN